MRLRRISTNSLETALTQIIRARTAGIKASIKPAFVSQILKELIDRRRDDKLLMAEVEQILGDNMDIAAEESGSKLTVDEVMSLSELGNSSWASGSDLAQIQWQSKEELKEELKEEPEEPDDIRYEDRFAPPISKHPKHVLIHTNRWDDGSDAARRIIIFAIVAASVAIFGTLLL